MPNDLAVRPISPSLPAVDAAAAPAMPTPQAHAPPGGKGMPNPSMRLDAALGLVVIEFHDEAGGVTGTIPDSRQLDAYRTAGNQAAQGQAAQGQAAQGQAAQGQAAPDQPAQGPGVHTRTTHTV